MKALTIVRILAGLGAAGVLAFIFLRDERPRLPPAHAEAPAPADTTAPLTRTVSMRPLGLADPARVDVLDAYAAAKAAVQEIQPGAELFGISGPGFVHGTVDLTRAAADAGPAASLLVQFEYARDGDAVKRHLDVRVEKDGLHITTIEGAVFARKTGGRPLKTLAAPTCSSRNAWAAAVESGVPEDTEVTFLLMGDDTRLVWSLRASNQPWRDREIDARTCSLVASAGKGKAGG